MDSQTICDYRMVNYMKNCQKKKITTQLEILPAGGTDTMGIQEYAWWFNSRCCFNSYKTHPSGDEMAHKNDIHQSIELLKACIENLDQ